MLGEIMSRRPLTEEEKKQRKEDLSMVTGTFTYHYKPGCTMVFHCKSEWEDHPVEIVLKDQEEATIPKFVKDYLNKYGYIEVAHKYLLDSKGNAVGVAQKTKKRVYSFR